MPHLRHGARADGRAARGNRQCGIDRFHPQALGRGAALAGAASPRHGRPRLRCRSPSLPVAPSGAMAEARPRHSGRAVVRLAVLRARARLASLGLAQHVHLDRTRHRRGLSLQRGRDRGARPVSRGDARRPWPGPDLFRGGGGDRGAGAARPGARAQGAREDGRRHSCASRPCAQDCAAGPERRQDRDRAARNRQGGRGVAGEARRQDPRRRHRDRRQERGR